MKYLNKTTVKKLQGLEADWQALAAKRTKITLQNRELIKEYDRLSNPGSPTAKFSNLLKRKDKHVKLRDRIEELNAELEGIEQELEELDKAIRAARLAVFNEYVTAAEAQDKAFRKAFEQLKSENQKLEQIFEEVAGVLNLSASGTTVPHYSRLGAVAVEVEDKSRFWSRSKKQMIGKLSEPDPDLMSVVYIRRKPRSACFIGRPASVPKETALKDIDAGYCVPVDEFEESMIP
jgi:DNA repair exonuclease SbcCD ATPase subunit